MDDARPRTPTRTLPIALGLALALLIGGGLGLGFAWRLAPRSLARFEARAGERVERDWDAAAARARVLSAVARETGGAEALAEARRDLRADLAASLPSGALPAVGPAGACAARLGGLARVLRALGDAAPVEPGSGPSASAPGEPAGSDAVREAAAARDPAALDAALSAELIRRQQDLFVRAAALDPRDRFMIWSEWRAATEARAAEFEFLAAEAEAGEPAAGRLGLAAHSALRGLAYEGRVADPSRALLEFPAEPARLAMRALPLYWGGFTVAGMLAGALVAGVGLALRTRRAREGLGFAGSPVALAAPAADPGDPAAWLHLVAGPDRERLGRTVCELAAHPLARRHKVVVVDASRRGRLHELLRLSSTLGFVECASQGLPALGLIQSGGFTRLFLLSRGGRRRVGDWLALDRVLEELRPHFGRVIVAFDAYVPAVVGGVLAGRVARGWWAGPGPADSGRGARAGTALATALASPDLTHVPAASLEALEARLVALSGAVSLAPDPRPEIPAPAPIAFRVSAPAVLEGDLQIRQRLRYLAWMRRVRSERSTTPEHSS